VARHTGGGIWQVRLLLSGLERPYVKEQQMGPLDAGGLFISRIQRPHEVEASPADRWRKEGGLDKQRAHIKAMKGEEMDTQFCYQ
jgi:hypothetical protein